MHYEHKPVTQFIIKSHFLTAVRQGSDCFPKFFILLELVTSVGNITVPPVNHSLMAMITGGISDLLRFQSKNLAEV
jgi:hypothetical protein